jgi:hypothetical protein
MAAFRHILKQTICIFRPSSSVGKTSISGYMFQHITDAVFKWKYMIDTEQL